MVGILKIDLKKIEQTIADVENKTSGEIVVWIAETSSSMASLRWGFFCLFSVLGFLGIELSGSFPFFGTTPYEHVSQTLLRLISGGMLGLALATLTPLTQRLARALYSKRLDVNVENRAFATFLKSGLTETLNRTGVLVFVSLFEHKVIILADQGINQKVDSSFWNKYAIDIAIGFKSKNPTSALEKSIFDIGAVLAQHFPPVDHNPNELSNRIRIGLD
jgi:putative membrane protein